MTNTNHEFDRESILDIIRHSLGLTRKSAPYRNHYCSEPTDDLLKAVELGWMTGPHDYTSAVAPFWHVTDAGEAQAKVSTGDADTKTSEEISAPLPFTVRHIAESGGTPKYPAGDANKLRFIALWFDMDDIRKGLEGTEVQDDLRRIADRLERADGQREALELMRSERAGADVTEPDVFKFGDDNADIQNL